MSNSTSSSYPLRLASIAVAALLVRLPAIAQHEHHATPPRPTEHAAHAEHADHVPSQAEALPAVTDAERAAAFPDISGMNMREMMLEDPLNKLVLLDRFESQNTAGNPLSWDIDAWVGRDLTKLWIRSEGEQRSGDTERAEVEVLFGKSFARWWDLVAGARYDMQPTPDRTWAAVGVRGTAPYRFEIEATAYAGSGNRTALRFESQHDILITNRWILQPQIELNWYGHAEPALTRGSGLSNAEMGLRLRYEVRREVAPYIGLARERAFGGTADLLRVAGRDTDDTRFVVGLRVWF